MDWIEPVYDRTQEDVDSAREAMAQLMASGVSLDDPQVAELKGCLNATDFNRIWTDVAVLFEILQENELIAFTFPQRVFTKETIPNKSVIAALLYGVSIVAVFGGIAECEVPGDLVNYEQVNAAELILHLTHENIKNMNIPSRHAGAVVANDWSE